MEIGTVIFLIFLVLKLTEVGVVATWSWWWVFSPIWIPLGLYAILAFVSNIILLILSVLRDRRTPEANLIPRRSLFWWV